MKLIIQKNKHLAWIAMLLALPTAYFIAISFLKYELAINSPFDTIAPFLERTGIRESLGWNINLLIVFGPVLAFLLIVLQLLKIDWQFNREQFDFHFTIKKRWFPLLIAGFSLSLLAILFIYLLGENCHCI